MAYAVFQTAALYRYSQYRKAVRDSRVENRGMQLGKVLDTSLQGFFIFWSVHALST